MTLTSSTEHRLDGHKFCSYRVGGPIDNAHLPESVDEAVVFLKTLSPQDPLTILGGGCNTMIASQGIRGATLISKKMMGIQALENGQFCLEAGLPLARVASLAQDHGLTGAEFMIGIPGTVGGAITMNAGAMKQSTHEIIEGALVFDRHTLQLQHWDADDLKFSYRHSAIDPQQHVVLAGFFRFLPGDPDVIAERMKNNLMWRSDHHPKEPNGGSVFKNPSLDHPAGRLLDELGAKGWQEGGAMVSPKHANFIVNVNHATSTDILKLMWRLKQAIWQAHHIVVVPENRFVGDATDEEQTLWKALTTHDDPS